jgi:hypothetical protein
MKMKKSRRMVMCKLFAAVLLGLMLLASCKSDQAKAFSDGCNIGAYGGLSLVGVQPISGLFKEQCEKLAQKYVNGDAELKKDAEAAETAPAPSESPSPAPSSESK